MSASHVYPRRRPVTRDSDVEGTTPKQSCIESPKLMTLRKGATFHPSAAQSITGPALDIPSLLRRSPTSPQTLQELVTASHTEKVSSLIEAFNKSFTGLADNAAEPLGSLATDISDRVLRSNSKHMSEFSKQFSEQTTHHHSSDSGIGSSISESASDNLTTRKRLRNVARSIASSSWQSSASSVYSTQSAITRSFSTLGSSQGGHWLGDKAVDQIKKHILEPILAEEKFKEYHPLIKEIPNRIKDRTIDCLRDLEKTLVFVTPEKSSSASSYLHFCETSIQCIHTTVTHLSGRDLCRPTDRAYTNTYFLDLHQQIQHYARIIAEARQKQAEGKKLEVMDYSPGEKLQLRGGLSKNGKALQLVREKDGKVMTMMGEELDAEEPTIVDEDSLDDDLLRSMGRKRKCDIGKEVYRACRECGKEFKRPCDLTKHEKTHSRPWKCPQSDCKYHEHGWPTEKERDRHVNDKHSATPSLFKCLFAPCPYSSKRESNCKQHMEKAHGWEYVRSKSKKGEHLVATKATPSLSMMPTPSSGTAFPSLSTPRTPLSDFSADNNIDTLTSNGSASPTTSEFMQSLQGVNTRSPFEVNDPILFGNSSTVAGQQGTLDFGFSTGDFTPQDPQLFTDLAQNNITWPPESFSTSSWMPTHDSFPPVNFQQPTPPWSVDMNFKFSDEELQMAPKHQLMHLTPNAQPDLMFTSVTPEDEGFVDGDYMMDKSDFQLFGGELSNAPYGGESSAMGAMFHDNPTFEIQYGESSIYDTTGGQFQMENDYLGDFDL